jgi:hypothetical protein
MVGTLRLCFSLDLVLGSPNGVLVVFVVVPSSRLLDLVFEPDLDLSPLTRTWRTWI